MSFYKLCVFRLVHPSTEWWIGAKVCLAKCPPSGGSRYSFYQTLQCTLNIEDMWKKRPRYLRHPPLVLLLILSEIETSSLGLPKGASKQWPYLKYWPPSDFENCVVLPNIWEVKCVVWVELLYQLALHSKLRCKASIVSKSTTYWQAGSILNFCNVFLLQDVTFLVKILKHWKAKISSPPI